jgi:flagellar hook-basal body complex protein FliE
MYINPDMATGHVVDLARTSPRHLPGTQGKLGPGPAPGVQPASRMVAFAQLQEESQVAPTSRFGELFIRAFERVNDAQLLSRDLSRQIVTDPDSVDVHDVTVAMAEANLALSMTKTIVDRAVRAYREITTLR